MLCFCNILPPSQRIASPPLPKRGVRRKRRQPKRTILIVTNGKRTELTYLAEMKRRSRLQNAQIKIEFVNEEPEGIIRKLSRPNGDTSTYDEVWIVVDEDGTDRTKFLAGCNALCRKHQHWYAVLSRPCFEVWLIAHYEQIANYATQLDAQRHFKRLVPPGTPPKSIPSNFPYDAVEDAIKRCHLPGDELGARNSMPSTPGTAMPHLVRHLKTF